MSEPKKKWGGGGRGFGRIWKHEKSSSPFLLLRLVHLGSLLHHDHLDRQHPVAVVVLSPLDVVSGVPNHRDRRHNPLDTHP